jgi:hypothetical protein
LCSSVSFTDCLCSEKLGEELLGTASGSPSMLTPAEASSGMRVLQHPSFPDLCPRRACSPYMIVHTYIVHCAIYSSIYIYIYIYIDTDMYMYTYTYIFVFIDTVCVYE